MRISLNLASRPFVELRPLFARLRLAMVALALLALGLGYALHSLNQRAAVASAEMNDLKARTLAYQQQLARNEARMRQPANAGVLERSRFLNSLFARKSFSWTAVMMDLERVLPMGVQVTSIDPTITKEGDVQIRLRVTGERDRAIQLVRNLERSQRFIAPRLAGESSLTAEKAKALGVPGSGASQANLRNIGLPGGSVNSLDPANAANPANPLDIGSGVEFEIFSNYNPLPEPHVKAAKATDAEDAPDIIANPNHVRHERRAKPSAAAPGVHLAPPAARGGAQ